MRSNMNAFISVRSTICISSIIPTDPMLHIQHVALGSDPTAISEGGNSYGKRKRTGSDRLSQQGLFTPIRN